MKDILKYLRQFPNVDFDTTGPGCNMTLNIYWKGNCCLCITNPIIDNFIKEVENSIEGYNKRFGTKFGLTTIDNDFMEFYRDCEINKFVSKYQRVKKLERILK